MPTSRGIKPKSKLPNWGVDRTESQISNARRAAQVSRALPPAHDPIETAINAARTGNGVDVSTKPIKWNPGVHKTTLYAPGVVGVPTTVFKGSLRPTMVQANAAVGAHTYGFQFHYNPETIDISYSMDSDVVPNASQNFDGNLYAHLQTVNMTLLLNRQAEVHETDPTALMHPCSADDLAMFRKFGTMYDLDFLWGAINLDDQEKPNTGVTIHDIGYLQVSALILQLGKYWKFPVLLTQVAITHTKFTSDMVPIQTTLGMSMTRMSAEKSAQKTIDTPVSP